MYSPPTILGIPHQRYRSGADFGIEQPDRLLHLLTIGQTGTGKTSLLANMTKQDAEHNVGFCLIDPHGDLASSLSQHLGVNHVYWDIADPNSSYGYNPLTKTSAGLRPLVASGLIETLKRQWADAWGARMEHLLRYGILALLETPRADLRDLMPLYTQKRFRGQVLSHVTDKQVLSFWQQEYSAMKYQSAAEGVAPIGNKIGSLLAHPVVRRALCEPAEPLRFRKLMDDGQSVIINLAKGRLGADMANLIGGLMVASIANAAFTRHDLPEADRRAFMLYVDEFSAFTTLSFATMLSEARKYGLGTVLAAQHVSQMETDVLHAVMGNVGSLVVFRLGALDAPLFVRQLETVGEYDLTRLPNHHALVQLMVRGQKTRTFSARTYPPFYA
ncbi:MAG: hypothetical protein AAFY84_16425 [Pseudomonadota bacterium]